MIKMKYKGFEFDINPMDISINISKNISQTDVPYSNISTKEMGYSQMTIKGKGYFVGENAMAFVMELMRVYNKKGSDFLFLPDSNVIMAYFSKLDINYCAGDRKVEYSFEFVEDNQGKRPTKQFDYTIAKENENLFDISYRTGISVESLASKNDFGDLFCVREGDKVWLI